jgi:apolipoprotein N-acyltransferase
MAKRSELDYRRAGVSLPKAPKPLGDRWLAKLTLILLGVALLTFSFAPFNQFYLSWVGLVPWLLMLSRVRSQRAAFLWGWLSGVLFFTANMWWLAYVTGPGLVALMLMLGLYWALAALLIRGAGLVRPVDAASPKPALSLNPSSPLWSVLLVPAIWVGLEWFRGNWPLNGLPWLFLGHAQTPALALCQVADVTGVYGVSFWVAALNTLLALLVLYRFRLRPLLASASVVIAMTLLLVGYGVFRLGQKDVLAPGPTVMVVQSNYPQSNTGEKGATYEEIVDFHVGATDASLRKHAGVNLVVWSETMMPQINPEARQVGAALARGPFWEETHRRLSGLAASHDTALLVGGLYWAKWRPRGDGWMADDRRNTAYLYDARGVLADERYDKIHIVPFGEYLPFKSGFPPLYKLFLSLSPYTEDYTLTPGSENAITVFELKSSTPPARFVTPICFEDIDPLLVGKMFRGGGGAKRADFIVNITNDGWFKFNEMPQHLQSAQFRSIENRAPTARSVNTGISGFVDSVGRTHGLIAAGIEGTSVQTLLLDRRSTVYTRWGDVFAGSCIVITLATAAAALVRWRRWRRVAAGVAADQQAERST